MKLLWTQAERQVQLEGGDHLRVTLVGPAQNYRSFYLWGIWFGMRFNQSAAVLFWHKSTGLKRRRDCGEPNKW